MKWVDKHIEIPEPRSPKKLTGTRFAAIFGLNAWATAFATWCEVTRTYEQPFVDTKYTRAGKAIEPKQARYMETYYGMNILTPEHKFGKDFFKKTRGDFFGDYEIFGGMWDFLEVDDYNQPVGVLEMKTTKRAEDWAEDIPEYYALQAALYAYMLGVDRVYMVVSFLEEGDYENPEDFKCSAHNTAVRTFKLSERYPHFEEDYIIPATDWWYESVMGGISPDYDAKRDAEILKELRTNNLSPDTDMDAIFKEAEELETKIAAVKETIAADEKKLTKLKGVIKEYGMEQFREGDKQVTMSSGNSVWTLARSVSMKVDEKAMKADGIYDKYAVEGAPTFRLTRSDKPTCASCTVNTEGVTA